MEKDVVLIDELIGEHKAIMRGARNLEQAAGDAEAIASLSEAKETFMPGRFGNPSPQRNGENQPPHCNTG